MPHVSPTQSHLSLRSLAELGQTTAAGRIGPCLVSFSRPQVEVSVDLWPVPRQITHPVDALVGYLAPPEVHALGLITGGRMTELAAPGAADAAPVVTDIRLTVVLDRSGAMVSILDQGHQPPRVFEDPAVGWGTDALARSLGRPTPPPIERLARVIEVSWLDAIAEQVFDEPGCLRTWSDLAGLHPFHQSGSVLPPALLAVEAEALELESSWARMRQLAGRHQPSAPRLCDPQPRGLQVRWEDWFDDGSFSRWAQRNQPPAEAILPAVLACLSDDLGAQLLDALITMPAP